MIQHTNIPPTAYKFVPQAQFNNFVDPSTIALAVGEVSKLGTAALNTINKTGLQGDVKAACGNKPLFPGKNKDAYNTCAANYVQAQLKLQAQQIQNQAQLDSFNAMLKSKSIGTGGIIAMVAGSLVLVGVLTYLIIKI